MTAIRCLIMHIRGYDLKAKSLAHGGYATSMVRQWGQVDFTIIASYNQHRSYFKHQLLLSFAGCVLHSVNRKCMLRSVM